MWMTQKLCVVSDIGSKILCSPMPYQEMLCGKRYSKDLWPILHVNNHPFIHLFLKFIYLLFMLPLDVENILVLKSHTK